MDILRWFFFLSLALLLIASCNNATSQFQRAQSGTGHVMIYAAADRPGN
jgi:hypothetical protein